MPGPYPRRSFVKIAAATAGGAAAAIGLPSLRKPSFAADSIKIGFVSPRTGPLASFGESDPYVLDLVRKALSKGTVIDGKRYAVEIFDKDTQSDPSRASQLAKELINGNGIDFMLTTSTPETVNPVSDACEAAGIPCLGTNTPWEAWYFGRGAKPGQPSPFKWTYLFSFGVNNFYKAYVSQWHELATNKKVAVLYPNDADGNAIRANLIPELKKAGFDVVDPGGFEDGTTDYSSQIAKFKSEGCEIFNTFPLPPDFATFWRQAAQQGFAKSVKIVQLAKTGLFPSNIEALGSLGDRLASACWWHRSFPYPSTLTGLSSPELADGYERAVGKQYSCQLGATMSLFDAGFAALGKSGNPKNKAAVARAIGKLKMTTMLGKIDFTSGPFPNVSPTNIIGTQWVKSKSGSKYPFEQIVTEHASDPNVPIGAKLLPYS